MNEPLTVQEAPASYQVMLESPRIKQGYKQTEVGVIPEDWDLCPVGSLTSYVNGAAHEKSISDSGQYVVVNSKFISTEGKVRKYSNECFCPAQPDDVLMVMSDVPNGRAIAKCFYVEEADTYTVNQRICILSPSKIEGKLLFYKLNRNKYYLSFDDGAKQTNLRKNDVLSCSLAIPSSRDEQHAIATALSDVDALLTAQDKLIAKKRDIKQAAMQQLLTGKQRLPGFTGEWSILSMMKHATLKARIGWQALTTEEYLDSGTHYLVTGTDFIGGRVNWSSCHFVDEWRYNQDRNIQLRDGDILLTKDGTIGKVGYVENIHASATLNSGVFVIRPIGAAFTPLFLFYILTSRIFDEFLAKITAGSTIIHLYQKDFVTFEFSAPCVDEQTAIATILSDMDADLSSLEQQRDKTRALKQGMMQELLTGRIRLV